MSAFVAKLSIEARKPLFPMEILAAAIDCRFSDKFCRPSVAGEKSIKKQGFIACMCQFLKLARLLHIHRQQRGLSPQDK